MIPQPVVTSWKFFQRKPGQVGQINYNGLIELDSRFSGIRFDAVTKLYDSILLGRGQ